MNTYEDKRLLLMAYLKLSIAKIAATSIFDINLFESAHDRSRLNRSAGKLAVYQAIASSKEFYESLYEVKTENEFYSLLNERIAYALCPPHLGQDKGVKADYETGIETAINDLYRLLFGNNFDPLGELKDHGSKLLEDLKNAHRYISEVYEGL